MAARMPRFVASYKVLYLVALVANLWLTAMWTTESGITPGKTEIYWINGSVLLLNVLAGAGALMRMRAAVRLERVLSVGRMIVLIGASTVVLGGLVVYSPVYMVLWRHVFRLAKESLLILWITVAALMAAEVTYFRKLRELS